MACARFLPIKGHVRATRHACYAGPARVRFYYSTHTGSSLQPIGYASSEPLYLCDEIHLKSSAGHRTWGRDFAYAEAARGPFPNARSACTCGGPAQRCCLLNATETEDPLLIHSMKLPFLVHNVLIETSSSSSPGHAAKNDMPGQTRCTAPLSTSCSVA